MKRVFLTAVIALSVAMFSTSCKDGVNKATDASTTEVVSDKSEAVSTEAKEIEAAVYQCPMDCEDGKTYNKPGNCPVCNMEIKQVKSEASTESKEVDEHAGHNHE